MVSSTTLLASVLLPSLSAAQSLSSYTITVNGYLTVVSLPPFTSSVPAPSATTATSTVSSVAVSPSANGGTTIPVTVNGYLTSIVLPVFTAPAVPATSQSPTASVVASPATSVVSSVGSVISSVAPSQSSTSTTTTLKTSTVSVVVATATVSRTPPSTLIGTGAITTYNHPSESPSPSATGNGTFTSVPPSGVSGGNTGTPPAPSSPQFTGGATLNSAVAGALLELVAAGLTMVVGGWW